MNNELLFDCLILFMQSQLSRLSSSGIGAKGEAVKRRESPDDKSGSVGVIGASRKDTVGGSDGLEGCRPFRPIQKPTQRLPCTR